MNQILSVDMPNNNARKSVNKKASTKSVIIFFCIILLILGIAMVALGIYSNANNKRGAGNIGQNVDDSNKPRIDVSQNASELNIEISGKNEIVKAEYSWNNGEKQEASGDGTNELKIDIEVPSGTNTFKIVATDAKGNLAEYSNEYVGIRKPNVGLTIEDDGKNKLKIACEEEEKITYISYYYDNEEETKKEVNDTKAEIEADLREGEHTLTVKVGYENGTEGKKSAKVYIPVVEKVQVVDGVATIKASDKRKITKVKINFNGQESEEEVNSENFEKQLQSQDGENRLILTVYNSENGVIVRRIRWVKQ